MSTQKFVPIPQQSRYVNNLIEAAVAAQCYFSPEELEKFAEEEAKRKKEKEVDLSAS